MKEMIWKELKENFKWAALATLGIGLIYVYALSQAFGRSQVYNPYQSQGLPMQTAITAPVVGILLGFLQIFPELQRDQWAFLLHRPVPRATLFWGKVLAGLLLLLPATMLPFLGAVVWMATPGRMAAPFDWRLALPGIADTLTGIVFYFAGILTALRPARWYGSRALGIAAALVCFFINQAQNQFWQSLLVTGAGAAVLLIAARGSFLTNGDYDKQPKIAKVALGTTLFAGTAVAVCGVLGLLYAVASTLIGEERDNPWNSYDLDKTGQILRVKREDIIVKSLTDLSGNPVAQAKSANVPPWGDFLSKAALNISAPRDWVPSYRSPSRYYMPLEADYGGVAGLGGLAWYYSGDRGLILGYSTVSKRVVGYLTPNGFLPAGEENTPASVMPFMGRLINPIMWYDNQHILAFPAAVYQLNLAGKRVTRIAAAAPAEPIQGALEVRGGDDTIKGPGIIVVAVKDRIRAYSPQGELLLDMPHEHDPKVYSYVQVSITPERDRLFFWYMPVRGFAIGQPRQDLPTFITEVSLAGGPQNTSFKRYTLPPLKHVDRPYDKRPALLGLLVPPGLAAGFTGYVVADSLTGNSKSQKILDEVSEHWTAYLIFYTLTVISGLICAGLTLIIARRCAFPRRGQWVWALGVLVLGPLGLLTLLALREWPARQVCPSCGKLRVVNRERCEHCGAGFTAPARDGTEIFEPVGG